MSLRSLLEDLRVLVVDDEEDVRRGIERLVRGTGAAVLGAGSGEEALQCLAEVPVDLVVTDVRMPGIQGPDLLRRIKAQWPFVEVVLVTGYGTIETAVACLQAGAAHFLTKPFDNEQITGVVERLGVAALARRRAQAAPAGGRGGLVAEDPRMLEVVRQIERLAPLPAPVLVHGRSGTGKEVVARALHELGRPGRPFLAVNCAALPDTLLESELFGHKRGAFSGAHRDHAGIFARAEGGTVLLDEIPSMSLAFQGKLLRVLEDRLVRPLGGSRDEPVRFRLVAAANRDLAPLMERGAFRVDLYYRLSVMTIRLPDLKDRPADLPALSAHFVAKAAKTLLPSGAPVPELSGAALDDLRAHDWPGNVRELENVLQRAVVAAGEGPILPRHLEIGPTSWAIEGVEPPSYEEGKQQALERFQRRFVLGALERSGGNVTRAAQACGLTRAALQRILKDLGIDRTMFKPVAGAD